MAQDHAKSLAGTQGFQLRLFSFAEIATLSPTMSWHTGRKATPQPLTPDAFRPKAPNSPVGAFLLDSIF